LIEIIIKHMIMRKFKVIESNTTNFKNLFFEIQTQIKQNVILPFTEDEYRCIMFDGIRVHLKKDDNYIVGMYQN